MHWFKTSATALLGAVLLSSCTARTGVGAHVVYGYPAVPVDGVPYYVYDYPSVYYRGRNAYLVRGRWYYPTSSGWVVFREEPRELRRYRVYYGGYGLYPGYDYHRGVRDPAFGAPIEGQRYRYPIDRAEPAPRSSPVERQRYQRPIDSAQPAPRHPAPPRPQVPDSSPTPQQMRPIERPPPPRPRVPTR